MNPYRVALILCRAVTIALWWSAFFQLLSGAIIMVVAQLNIGAFKGIPVSSFALSSVTTLLPLIAAAIFLQIFGASLAASMTGSAAFEGDAISSRRGLDATELALARAGAGLFLLFFGAAGITPTLLSGGYAIFFGGMGSGVARGVTLFSMTTNLIPMALQCLVGFVLAFMLGLRRMMKSQ